MAPRELELLLPQLVAFPPNPAPSIPLPDDVYDKEIKKLRKILNDTPANVLTGEADLFEIIDPSINTLPYLYTLLGHLNANRIQSNSQVLLTGTGSPLWLKIVEFLERFDPVQVRYVGAEFKRLIVCVRDSAQADHNQISAIRPIRSAILRLDPSGSCFTSTHLLFVHLCLDTHAFRAAKPVLDKDIFDFPAAAKLQTSGQLPCSAHDTSSGFITEKSDLSDSLNYRDVLQYFLYGAMMYIALREWKRAILFLEIVLIAPVKNHASMIQVEAYKKWVLVKLLAGGRVPGSLPKTVNTQAAKQYRALGKAYDALGEIFQDGISKEVGPRRLNAEVHAGTQKWAADCNMKLIIQVIDAYRQFSILKLESTYTALLLPDVSRRTSPNSKDHTETAQYLSAMINSGQLNASLIRQGTDPRSWILRFAASSEDGPQAQSEKQQYEELVLQAAKTSKIAEHVQESNRKLSLNVGYVKWLVQAKKNQNLAGARADETAGVANQDAFDVDEDLMGGD